MEKQSNAAVWLAIVGVVLFTTLLLAGKVGSTAYVSLLLLLSAVCMAIYGFNRLRMIDLKSMRLILDKVEQARNDVFAKEEDLRHIALELGKMFAFNSALQGRVLSRDTHELASRWYRVHTLRLLEMLHVGHQERGDVMSYYNALDRLRRASADSERLREHETLMDMIRSDIERTTSK